jgi:hypothetical protein
MNQEEATTAEIGRTENLHFYGVYANGRTKTLKHLPLPTSF